MPARSLRLMRSPTSAFWSMVVMSNVSSDRSRTGCGPPWHITQYCLTTPFRSSSGMTGAGPSEDAKWDEGAVDALGLFQRILQNAIRDHYRRQKVRSFWVSPLSALKGSDADDDDSDPLETLQVGDDSKNHGGLPAEALQQAQVLGLIEKALEALPFRQRQAFLLRYWEDLDVAETASVMGCSEGSVKTHCSRAVHALAKALAAKGLKP